MKTPIYIYDLEVYPNFFGGIFYNYFTKEVKEFRVYKATSSYNSTLYKNEIRDLFSLLCTDAYFVGYNNTYYDNQILEYIYQYYSIISREKITYINEKLYELSSNIINNNFTEFKYAGNVKHFDLMRIGGGKGLMKSLKSCACNLKHDKIQDLPINPTEEVKYEDIDELMKYCQNDVNITVKLFENLLDKILLRVKTWDKFKINVLNQTDSGIANRLLEKMYVNKTGDSIKDVKKQRKFRNNIPLEDVINEDIKFESKELSEFLVKLKAISVDTSPDKDKITIESHPIVEYDGISYKIGAGGIHSVDEGIFYEESETEKIKRL
jgi:hypothetical protein